MRLFIFPHPHIASPLTWLAHINITCFMFCAHQREATRWDSEEWPTIRDFAEHVLQYCKLSWLLRSIARFIISVEDCELDESIESGRRKQPLLVWTNDFPFILQAHCFHFWRRNLSFLEPEPDADRVCLRPHTLVVSLFKHSEVFNNQWKRFFSQ